MVSGAQPLTASMRAPMRVSGSMTRFIGRPRSEASPVIVAVKGCAARMPASSRVVVPEFCASSVADGAASRPRPRPSTTIVERRPVAGSASRWIVTPSARRQSSVAAQSAPGE